VNQLGFTYSEAKVILFLTGALVIGSVIEIFKDTSVSKPIKFDYSQSDSIFLSKQKNNSIKDKKFDYKQEVLDFSTDKVDEKSKKITNTNKKFDLNSITENELIQLPGIGVKAAQNIIAYRNKNGKFTDINELLEIKGVGEKKLIELKKFLIIK